MIKMELTIDDFYEGEKLKLIPKISVKWWAERYANTDSHSSAAVLRDSIVDGAIS